MNTSSPHPRLVCRCAQLARAVYRDAFAGHVAGCEDCQQALAADHDLDSLLRRDATRLPQPDLSRLESAIISAVHRAPRSEPAARMAPWAWAGAALAAAAAIAVTFTFRPTAPSPVQRVAHMPNAEVVAPGTVIKELSDRLFDSVVPAAEYLQRDPLQREMDSIRADARSALSFLAMNFLPTASAQAALEPRQI